jgi:hypothetical protein
MKKLLILFVVLGLASAAHAASCTIELEVDGSNTYNPADGLSITVDMVINVNVSSIYNSTDATAGIDFITEMTVGTATVSVGDWIPAASNEDDGTLSGDDILDAFWFKAGGASDHPANTIIYSFAVTLSGSDALGDITPTMTTDDKVVKGLASHWWSENTYVPLEIVPEPMTIALLGLGALFLRRRK